MPSPGRSNIRCAHVAQPWVWSESVPRSKMRCPFRRRCAETEMVPRIVPRVVSASVRAARFRGDLARPMYLRTGYPGLRDFVAAPWARHTAAPIGASNNVGKDKLARVRTDWFRPRKDRSLATSATISALINLGMVPSQWWRRRKHVIAGRCRRLTDRRMRKALQISRRARQRIDTAPWIVGTADFPAAAQRFVESRQAGHNVALRCGQLILFHRQVSL